MKQYDSYKDSGTPWIGQIPSHWEVNRMRYIISYEKGKNPKELFFECDGEMRPYLSMDHLRESFDFTQYCYAEGKSIICKDGDVVLLWDGSNAGEFIKSKDGILCSTCALIKPKGVHPQYFWYLCKSFQSYLQDMTNGMGVPHVDSEALKNITAIIPPSSEQRDISAYLDRKCGSIDKVIATQVRRIEMLGELKQSIITEAVTRGINPDAPLKDSGIDWIGKIPQHWEIKRYKNIMDLKTTPSNSDIKIGLENIESGSGMFVESESEFEGNGVQFKKGDIVYGKLRPYLRKVWLAEFEGNAVGDFFVFTAKKAVSNKFLKYLLLSDIFTSQANGATNGAKMPRVSSSFILTLKVAIPNFDEQIIIANYIETKLTPIDSAIAKAKREVELLREFKQSVITEAVTGKITVC